MRKYIKKRTRQEIEKVKKDIPQILDMTNQMEKEIKIIEKSDYINITKDFLNISKKIEFLEFIYINKDKFKKILKDFKITKYSLEIEYSVVVQKKVFRRKIGLTKLKHSLFLCPNPDDLINLS